MAVHGLVLDAEVVDEFCREGGEKIQEEGGLKVTTPDNGSPHLHNTILSEAYNAT